MEQALPVTAAPGLTGTVSATPAPAIEVVDLVKRYPKARTNAVDGISFQVAPGELFGLLGPNGAGKTTTIGVLTTRVRPTRGQARVGGVDVLADPVAARARLAVVPQRSNLDRSLSVRDNLLFHAAYHGVPATERARRADELLEAFGLAERAGAKPDFFSGGQAQRMMIARALMHAPAVLFLDEPSTGLDPAARLFVWDRVRELTAVGITVLLTTHSMEEAAALCDRVGIVDHGRLLALDTPAALVGSLPLATTLDLVAEADPGSTPGIRRGLAGLAGVERIEAFDPPTGDSTVRWRIWTTGDAAGLLAPAAEVLAGAGARLSKVDIGTPTLEDVFIHLTGRALR